jgi:hypothetical protein
VSVVQERQVELGQALRVRQDSVSASTLTIGSGTWMLSGSSRRDLRDCSMFRHTRATTVVSHPPRFSISLESDRLSRSQASWTASSASLREPSIRYATARRCALCSSKRPASHSRSSIAPSSLPRAITMTDERHPM